MKKTWRNIIIVSLVLILLETAAILIFLKPYYDSYRVYKSIEGGNWIETQETYDKLTFKQQERVQSYLPDYANWLAAQYMDGAMIYEDVAASFDAVNAIDDTRTLYGTYMYDISKNEYIKVINGMHKAVDTLDTKGEYDYRQTLNAINHRLGYDVREDILVNMLNIKYQQFLNEEITVDSMKNFYNLVIANSIYTAYDYAGVISHNVDCVIAYRSVYENAVADCNEDRYFEAMELCNIIVPAGEDTLYQNKIRELFETAYEAGKEYYPEKIQDYVNQGKKGNAVELMGQVEDFYGDDIDLTYIKEDMASDWQLAAIDVVNNWEKDLEDALSEFSTGEYILEHEYDNKLKPDSLVFYDINGDLVPELFMFNSDRADNEYVECFIYVYNGETYEFEEFLNVKHFCTDSNIVVFPSGFDRAKGDECQLVFFDGSSFYKGDMCQLINDVYYVNGAETDDLEYLETQTEILSHINERVIANCGYSSLKDGEGYILAY